jgi:hypothetical protein
MRRIFTTRFFHLTAQDQAAIVDSAIRDLESCIGRLANPGDDSKIRQQIKRIERKVVEYGVYEDDNVASDLASQPSTTGGEP